MMSSLHGEPSQSINPLRKEGPVVYAKESLHEWPTLFHLNVL